MTLVNASNLLYRTSLNWNVNIGNANSQSFTIGIVVNGWYARNSAADDTVVTVSKPIVGDFVNGGGFLILTRSGGPAGWRRRHQGPVRVRRPIQSRHQEQSGHPFPHDPQRRQVL